MYAGTHLLVAHTHWGRQARAVSDDAPTARLVGVNDKRFFALIAGFVMVVTGLAAVLNLEVEIPVFERGERELDPAPGRDQRLAADGLVLGRHGHRDHRRGEEQAVPYEYGDGRE